MLRPDESVEEPKHVRVVTLRKAKASPCTRCVLQHAAATCARAGGRVGGPAAAAHTRSRTPPSIGPAPGPSALSSGAAMQCRSKCRWQRTSKTSSTSMILTATATPAQVARQTRAVAPAPRNPSKTSTARSSELRRGSSPCIGPATPRRRISRSRPSRRPSRHFLRKSRVRLRTIQEAYSMAYSLNLGHTLPCRCHHGCRMRHAVGDMPWSATRRGPA